MKNILVSIICLIYCSGLSAQTYHPLVQEGRIWSTYHRPCVSDWDETYSDYTKIEGDTLIEGMLYKKIWTCTDTTSNSWESWSTIREDSSRRVFYKGGVMPDRLVYDFSVEVGDTLPSFYPGSPYHVDSIDSVQMLNGEFRRQFHLSLGGYSETWIEGVGSLDGLIMGLTYGWVGDNPELICMLDNGDLIYHNDEYEECHYISGMPENLLPAGQMTIQPNPARGPVMVTLHEIRADRMRVFDMLQREVMVVFPVQDHPLRFVIPGLRPGSYFLEAGGRSGRLLVTE